MKEPKDKAVELVNSYLRNIKMIRGSVIEAKKCATMDVQNTLDVLSSLKAATYIFKEYRYWIEVKFEINK